MQGSAELEILHLLSSAIVFLVAWYLPTGIVLRCHSRKDTNEGSICHRTTQYSNAHPVRMIILESVPGFLCILFQNLFWGFILQMLAPLWFACYTIRIAVAWRTNKYEV